MSNITGTIRVNTTGWINEAVGRKIEFSYPDSVTEIMTYKQDSTVISELTVVYSDSSKKNITSVERTA